jgi:hypothetical protein
VLISRLSRSHADSSAFLQAAAHKYENKHGARVLSAEVLQQNKHLYFPVEQLQTQRFTSGAACGGRENLIPPRGHSHTRY